MSPRRLPRWVAKRRVVGYAQNAPYRHTLHHYHNAINMTPRLAKRAVITDDPVQELSQSAAKRARTTISQSTLPFAPPLLSPAATQSPPVASTTPCPFVNIDDFEALTEKTIRADERSIFEPDWTRVVEGELYRERARTLRSTGSSRLSFIYKHGLQVERRQPNGSYDKIFWICKHCNDRRKPQTPLTSSATSTAIAHLKNVHLIVSTGRLAEPPESIVSHLTPAAKPQQTPAAEAFITKFIDWVVAEDITFSQASSHRLRDLVAAGGAKIAALLPSANTVRAWIIKTCNEQRKEVINNIRRAQGKVSLSWDIWTTSNDQSLLGVCAHWIDTTGNKQEALIALPRIRSHHGNDIADTLDTVIKPYGISDSLGAFQGDNASNNDTTVDALRQWYHIDIKEQRLRCLGHIINLVI